MKLKNVKNMEITEDLLKKRTNGFYNIYGKRFVDIVIAIPAFVLLLPVYLLISFAIALESGFPVIYRGIRGGYTNKPFRIMKFRSMVKNAEKVGGPTTALHDPRITKVGFFLRRTKLDEIPQLVNIIIGEMSFVGPRPEVLKYVDMFEGVEKYILQVRPGITDWSSLEFSNMDAVVGDGDVDKYFVENILAQKNKLRVKYVAELSFKNDVVIFFKTIVEVLKHCVKK